MKFINFRLKIVGVFSFFVFAQICEAQKAASQEIDVIDVSEVVGVWTGSIGTFTPLQNGDLSKGLGLHNSKTSSVPSNSPLVNHLVIDSFGNFTNANYTNSKWKIVDHYLIVTTEYGKEIRGFLSPDSTTHTYRLTFEGQVFTREKKIDLDQGKK